MQGGKESTACSRAGRALVPAPEWRGDRDSRLPRAERGGREKYKQKENYSVEVDQAHYLDIMEEIPLTKERRKDEDADATPEEVHEYRSLVGCLRWLADGTRPDLSVQSSMLASLITILKVKDIIWCNKVLREANKRKDTKLVFKGTKKLDSVEVQGFGDAAFQNLPNGRTQGGTMVVLATYENQCVPILWKSRKVVRVVKSTLAREVITAGKTMDFAMSIRDMWYELRWNIRPLRSGTWDDRIQEVPLGIWCDANSVITYVNSLTRLPEERRLVADFLVLTEALETGDLAWLRHCKDPENIADGLTKVKLESQRKLAKFMSESEHPVPTESWQDW